MWARSVHRGDATRPQGSEGAGSSHRPLSHRRGDERPAHRDLH